VVLDTNVLVSALLESEGYPAGVVRAWRAKRYVLVTSAELVAEIRRVTQYARLAKWLRRRQDAVDELLDDLEALAVHTEGELSLDVLSDPDDNAILEAAVEGAATVVVTGNKHPFEELGGTYEGVEILSPREFWERLESGGGG
jgi:putative PIN family toxin of toxin-antitoxin system